ncbi:MULTISPECIES: arylsulfatase [Bacteroides]|uniref:arylsulfatase n=1 Tax=Bacteroides TaxID=816 RepID=UPI001F1BFDC2|nr:MULTISPECIES: arylsulfatase [Bacteroides]MCF2736784.1 arylsulfatase [Bacteroides caecigallinarum]
MKTFNFTYILSFAAIYAANGISYGQNIKRPNILVILADDLGYSDIGCYGGEVKTPNLDRLAENGVRFTHFYNTSRSCPTRASLLTGLYPHQAGVGRMTFDDHKPGYRGTMTHNGVTIAEVLKENNYNTAWVGKWHVAETPLRPDQRQWLAHQVKHDEFAPKENYPINRGFQDCYGTIYGVVDYFDPFSLIHGEDPVESVPDNYYSTIALSDTAVAYVNKYAKSDKPFFMYLAYHSPHWPLHALPEDIKKYENRYRCGWQKIREERYNRQKKMKLFGDCDNFLSERQFNDSWENNPDKEWDAYAMAVHAAMIDRMDQGIGKVIDALEKNGQLDNTLILFMSDNGCSNEDCQNYPEGENDRPAETRDGRKIVYPRNKEVLPGPETSYASVGAKWANVANTPFRFWKAKTYEGGICTPMIAHWPKGIKLPKGSINTSYCHVIDIMATCLELSGSKYPSKYNGYDIQPYMGLSMKSIFDTGKLSTKRDLYFEHFNEKALIDSEGWKIVQPAKNNGDWELYNLNSDRSEMHNLADKYPDRVKEMLSRYDKWEKQCKVVPRP